MNKMYPTKKTYEPVADYTDEVCETKDTRTETVLRALNTIEGRILQLDHLMESKINNLFGESMMRGSESNPKAQSLGLLDQVDLQIGIIQDCLDSLAEKVRKISGV